MLALILAPILLPAPLPPISPDLYRTRREQVKQAIGPRGIALILTNPTRNRSNDTDFRFRPNSNFWYLTGFEEPDAALLLAPGGVEIDGKRVTEVLFTNIADPMSETWLGPRMGPARVTTELGLEVALPNSRFRATLSAIPVANFDPIDPLMPDDATGTIQVMAQNFRDWTGDRPRARARVVGQAVDRLRVKKSAPELARLRRAIDATVAAHAEAIRSAEPGMYEFEIQAAVEYIFARNGCSFTAYNSIVGSGPNSCILHYETNRKQMKAGEIVTMDVGGEFEGYAADVTRAYPVNGKFTREQRAIYDLVLAAQDAGIAECRVDQPFAAPHRAAQRVIADGLFKLGITKTPQEAGRYFMHGTSHYIGLDVHDSHGDNVLRENATLTVEPGIYIKTGSPCDPKWWNIGVRIEDDILVTSKGPVNLSGALPRQADAIERLMRGKGLANSTNGVVK